MFDALDFIILGAGISGIIILIIEFLSRKMNKRKVVGFNTIKVVGYELLICSIGGMVIYRTIEKIVSIIEKLL